MILTVRLFRRFVLFAVVTVSVDSVNHTAAHAQPMKSEFAVRALSNTIDDKDKVAISAWKAAFAKVKDDVKLAEKLEKAAQDNVAPALLTPKEGDDADPAKYEFIKMPPDVLLLLGIDAKSPNPKQQAISKLIDQAREKKEAVELAGKNLYVYSWKDSKGDPQIAVLSRPTKDNSKVTGRELASVKAVPDPEKFGEWGVVINLSKDGAKRFKAFSEENQKKSIVLLVDDKALFALRLGKPIDSTVLEFSGRLDQRRALSMQVEISRCIAPKETNEANRD